MKAGRDVLVCSNFFEGLKEPEANDRLWLVGVETNEYTIILSTVLADRNKPVSLGEISLNIPAGLILVGVCNFGQDLTDVEFAFNFLLSLKLSQHPIGLCFDKDDASNSNWLIQSQSYSKVNCKQLPMTPMEWIDENVAVYQTKIFLKVGGVLNLQQLIKDKKAMFVSKVDDEGPNQGQLKLEILVYIPKNGELVIDVQEQLLNLVNAYVALSMEQTGEKFYCETTFTFRPTSLGHHLTILPDKTFNMTDKSSEPLSLSTRQHMHRVWSLPCDQPTLRRINALSSASSAVNTSTATILKNVHLKVPPSNVKGGKVHLVNGSYDYFHYLQGQIDDKGWGCAYRSLQTIFSWFKYQHLTNKPVPNHREIQRTLVKIGDKDISFVGSKQWIGAIELGFVLEDMLDVTCKIINISSGAEILSKASELAWHFDTQGTPIMIGGGVLAYTLLGVHYNELTDDCEFLILDPHYTGTDDLNKIISGKWIAWRKQGDKSSNRPLFTNDSFYNLLCPQKPNMI